MFILLLFLLFSCTRPPADFKSAAADNTVPIASEVEDSQLLLHKNAESGEVLRLALSRAPTGFLSYANNFSSSNEFITGQILLPLLERHPVDESLRPSLAEKWQWTDNGRTLKFTLRKNLYWSDGAPLTTKDVLFTFENLILNPNSPANYLEVFSAEGKVGQILIEDDRHFEFQLPAPLAAVPYALTYLPILPAHKISAQQLRAENLSSLWNTSTPPEEMAASGPFVLKKYYTGSKVVLERNPYFFRVDHKGCRLPYADKLELLVAGHASQRTAMFAAGKIDFFEPPPQDFLLLQKMKNNTGKYRLFHGSPAKNHPSVTHIAFNFDSSDRQKSQLFRNTDFRIAMEYLLDRNLIIDQIYQGLARIQGAFITQQNLRVYDAESDKIRRSHNPEKAKKILDSLGLIDRNNDGLRDLPDGSTFILNILTPAGTLTGKEADIALLYSLALNEAGIQTTLQKSDAAAFAEKISRSDFDVVLRSIGNSPDPLVRVRVIWQPGQFLYYFHPSTYNKENNTANLSAMTDWETELYRLYEQANITFDPARRKQYYDRIQRIYAEKLPVIFTVRQDNLYAVQKEILNAGLNKQGLLIFTTWTAAKKTTSP